MTSKERSESEEKQTDTSPTGTKQTPKEEQDFTGSVSDNDDDFERIFPSCFYDPSTGHIMINPFVDANGDSYEKTTHTQSLSASSQGNLYPNRAMRTIIQHELQRRSSTLVGSIRRIDDSTRKGWNQLVDRSVLAMNEYRPLPESMYCPITSEIMTDPAIGPDGHSFERVAILNWVEANHTDPITRKSLSKQELRPNNALYALIQEEKNKTDEMDIHPSIRRWKESEPTTSRRVWSERGEFDEESFRMIHGDATPTPVTYAEISAARRHRSGTERSCSMLICFTFLVALLFLPTHIVFLTIIILLCCMGTCMAGRRGGGQGLSPGGLPLYE